MSTTSEPETIVGVSQAAIVIDEPKTGSWPSPAENRPAPTDVKFVTLGDPDNPRGLLPHMPLPFPGLPQPVDTPYDTRVVVKQYDGFADFPDGRCSLRHPQRPHGHRLRPPELRRRPEHRAQL